MYAERPGGGGVVPELASQFQVMISTGRAESVYSWIDTTILQKAGWQLFNSPNPNNILEGPLKRKTNEEGEIRLHHFSPVLKFSFSTTRH